jgi:hypothetical protein
MVSPDLRFTLAFADGDPDEDFGSAHAFRDGYRQNVLGAADTLDAADLAELLRNEQLTADDLASWRREGAGR